MKWTIAKIKQANEAAGGVFFDKSHLKHSRTLPEVYQGEGRVLFITQDEGGWFGERETAPPVFRAWEFDPQTGRIRIVAAFATAGEAQDAAKRATEPQEDEAAPLVLSGDLVVVLDTCNTCGKVDCTCEG